MSELLAGFSTALSPWPLFYTVIGTLVGVVVGAIPGLSGGMLVALALPITFAMEPISALVMLTGMYTGSISGGLITATLLRMPGDPASVMTIFDGYPLAKSGQPGRALGLGNGASFIGGLVSWFFLASLAPALSDVATRFGPFEYFSLVLMALVLIAAVSAGSFLKGILSGFLGMLVTMPGTDPATGVLRLTFGIHELAAGFHLLPVLIGVFAIGQILTDLAGTGHKLEPLPVSTKGILMSLRDLKVQAVNLIRSSLIGTWIGIMPGVGGNVGSLIAYTVARNMSRIPEKFGKGSEEAIVASESANNATVCGALIPMLAMGIPGSVIAAIMMGAFVIHGMAPGPLLFINNANIVYTIIATCFIANVVMFVFMTAATRPISRLMNVDRAHLYPAIIVCCVLGAYGVNNRMFDVWVMLLFGLVGYGFERAKVPIAPFVIGVVLAPIAETTLRSGLMASAGSYWPLVTRPISCAFLLASAILLAWPFYRQWRQGRVPRASLEVADDVR
jgi:putative tricarboxylic transport membrane protein